MMASEEVAASVKFLDQAKVSIKKEWSPLLTGRSRHVLAAIPDWVFFLRVEESPGQSTKYVAKLEADEQNVGVAKPRLQPFVDPRRLLFPKGQFYQVFSQAIEAYQKSGKPVSNP